MNKYRLHVHDSTYTTWTWIPETPDAPEPPEIPPTKMFSKDIILYDQPTKTHTVIYSHVRSKTPLAGILVLQGNRTYGRTTKHKLLYKLIPDDKHLPVFLVPYDPPANLSKVLHNKYVVFHFDDWIEQHPRAKLLQTLGDTQQLDSFYEYQLYCKSLHVSLTPFSNQTKHHFNNQPASDYIDKILANPTFNIQDRRDQFPFSIDPPGSTDFDDAFSIHTTANKTHVSIYIANVYVWLDTLNLWTSMTNRVSTIYLPDRKRPMLPTILSDQLCSLQQDQPRFAFAIDLTYDTATTQLTDYSFAQALIQVKHNFRYETPALHIHPQYKSLYDLTKALDKNTADSHDLVAFWMIEANKICGEHLAQHKRGIFRQAIFTKPTADEPEFQGAQEETLSKEARQTIQLWNNVSGQYVLYNESPIKHDVMKLAHYTHITSPIRRLVDLLNQLTFISLLDQPLSKPAQQFLDQWIAKLPYINTSMRSIRKIQTDCEVLYRCYTDPSLVQTTHKGILFDKVQKNDGGFVYMVYLEGLRLLTRFKSYEEYENLSHHPFQLFLFTEEHSLKKKIRVQIQTI
jgi:exoribonuclease R